MNPITNKHEEACKEITYGISDPKINQILANHFPDPGNPEIGLLTKCKTYLDSLQVCREGNKCKELSNEIGDYLKE